MSGADKAREVLLELMRLSVFPNGLVQLREAIRHLEREVRNEALEEAARDCEVEHSLRHQFPNDTQMQYAERIRALKDTP